MSQATLLDRAEAVADSNAPTKIVTARSRILKRRWVAGLVLGLIYLVLSFAAAPAGEVADVGGKLATLHVMEERGTWTPDVGYWAADADPTGALHPLFFTSRVGDTWAQVTTLPMLYAAYPLYALGGDRAVVLLPILGAIACAFAARALARRLGGGTGWTAFWAVGLATPVAVYAMSFWEHTIGLALMAWAVIALLDVYEGRAGPRTALLAGLLFGVAATMRTEAFVYGAVGTLVVCGGIALARRWRAAVVVGIAVASGFAVVIGANQVLERAVFGVGTRSARTAGTAAHAAGELGTRFDLATTSFTGMNGFAVSIDWVVGAVAIALLVAGVLLLRYVERRIMGIAFVALAATLYLLRVSAGAGYVPGLLTASPLAAVGIVVVWQRRARWIIGVLACAPIPFVWATQYADTMRWQWGGRYLFMSGFLLAVVAIVALRGNRAALTTVIVAGAVVAIAGFSFVVARSHSIADGSARVLGSEPALVSMEPHFFREAGARYDPDARWLTAEDGPELRRAASVLADAGDTRFAVVAARRGDLPDDVGAFQAIGPARLVATPLGETYLVRRYHAA